MDLWILIIVQIYEIIPKHNDIEIHF